MEATTNIEIKVVCRDKDGNVKWEETAVVRPEPEQAAIKELKNGDHD